MTAGGIASDLWYMNQEFSPVDISSPWLSIFISYLAGEELTRWWPQFRDVLSPYRLVNDDDRQQYAAVREC
jgi:hypothetical protein